MTEKDILIYKTREGKEPFMDWLFSLRDKIIRHRIETRIDRIRHGNYGDHKRFMASLNYVWILEKGTGFIAGKTGTNS